jgi:DNA-binding response OmpR family regulator
MQAIRRIQAQLREEGRFPMPFFALLTAMATTEARKDARELGCTFVSKPVKLEALRAVINLAIQHVKAGERPSEGDDVSVEGSVALEIDEMV